MSDDRLKELRDALFRACEGYNGDESVRAMASAMATLVIGCTKDRDQARAALAKLYTVMRGHIDAASRPPGTTKQ
jgi:hypothetical protein